MAATEQPDDRNVVRRGRIGGTQLEPLPGRRWLLLPVDLLGNLPIALINRLAGGRLDRVAWALLRWQCRVV